jgi:hypothetical protein
MDRPKQVGSASNVLKRQFEKERLNRLPSGSFSRIGALYSLLFLMAWSKIVGFEVSPVTDSSSM